MEKSNRGIMLAAAPAAMAALVLGLIAPGTALLGTQATTDSVGPHGYVVVTVTRDGQEIYRHEDHNLITNAGKDFISAQLGSTSPGANGANYIALSADTGAPAAGDTTLTGEITTGGLARTQGAYAHTNGQSTYTVSNTFTASATHNNVQKAGLFTAGTGGTMMAENTFTAVSLANGDQLTITWTITLT
ncbi:MAG: hypothetical protein QXJ74_09900 [Nitrososphaera sp.]|uniref:hypothetical protein n=1 Tax=Nitrososphaera sp. TaxID=1971748 RepID=UPI0017C31447|nr:hypothetical protein [Nitrososphaera sp.]NWG37195.1 hypothetical protein [Nitrososphaera sp.]